MIAGQREALLDLYRRHVTPGEPYALVDFPDHPNVGDSAIWLGEIALLRFQRRMGTVRVTSPLRAVTVSADELQVIEEEMPEIGGHLRAIMTAREREIADRADG